MTDQTHTERVVLSGGGPHISLRLPDNGKVVLVTNDQVKTINVAKETEINFAA